MSGFTGKHRRRGYLATHLDTGFRPSRRALLGAAGAGTAALLVGGIAIPSADAAVLASYGEIYSQRTYYHNLNTDAIYLARFSYNPTFYYRLETWFAFWRLNTPGHWTAPHRIGLNGVYVNKPGWHGYGRAMDISRIDFYNTRTGTYARGFDGRYNVWRYRTGTSLIMTRRLYWGTVASLNYHFRDVLHYQYNSAHHNHVHADNGISGSGNSSYSTGSTTQTKFIQSALNYIWGYGTSIDGGWGPQTDGNSRRALSRIGRTGSITSQSNWLAFCRATFRFSVGTQSY